MTYSYLSARYAYLDLVSGEVDLQSWVGPEQGLTDLMRATQKTLEIIRCGEGEKLIFFEQLIHELTFSPGTFSPTGFNFRCP